MNTTDLEYFANGLNCMCDASGDYIRKNRLNSFDTEIKGDGSPVTSVDQGTELCVREIISDIFPNHGITGEEFDDLNPDREFVWAIDPIDGTLPFLAGLPVFGTLIALLHNSVPILGAIDMPITRERWIGGGDRPTTLNGTPVKVRACESLSQAMLSTSNPDFYDAKTEPAFHAVRDASRLNIYGGSCMAYAQIASGRIDVGMDVQFDIHDYLPLVPVINGAGGIITDWDGKPLDQNSGDKLIAAGDPRVHEEALKLLQI